MLKAIGEAFDDNQLNTANDLLKIVSLPDLAWMCDLQLKHLTRWIQTPGTLPEMRISRVSSRLELSEPVVRGLFGLPPLPPIDTPGDQKLCFHCPIVKVEQLAAELSKAHGCRISFVFKFESEMLPDHSE